MTEWQDLVDELSCALPCKCEARAGPWWLVGWSTPWKHVLYKFRPQPGRSPEKPTSCSSAGTVKITHEDKWPWWYWQISVAEHGQSCCLMHSSHLAPLALVLRFPKSRLQHFVCKISLWISMISPILSCISALQTLAKQHKDVFCQIHWASSPNTLCVFLLLLSVSGKTSPHYVKSYKKL